MKLILAKILFSPKSLNLRLHIILARAKSSPKSRFWDKILFWRKFFNFAKMSLFETIDHFGENNFLAKVSILRLCSILTRAKCTANNLVKDLFSILAKFFSRQTTPIQWLKSFWRKISIFAKDSFLRPFDCLARAKLSAKMIFMTLKSLWRETVFFAKTFLMTVKSFWRSYYNFAKVSLWDILTVWRELISLPKCLNWLWSHFGETIYWLAKVSFLRLCTILARVKLSARMSLFRL